MRYQHWMLLSAVEQIEVSCRERRESVPVQVVNRRWRLRGGRVERGRRGEKREWGGLLLPLHNEWGEMPHICCGGFNHFIQLYVWVPEPSSSLCKNVSFYICGDIALTINDAEAYNKHNLHIILTLTINPGRLALWVQNTQQLKLRLCFSCSLYSWVITRWEQMCKRATTMCAAYMCLCVFRHMQLCQYEWWANRQPKDWQVTTLQR